MSSNFDWEWTGNQKRWTEDERKKMQEAFDYFHQSKEWDMICVIYEVDDCFDIVIRDEEDINCRCLHGEVWEKAYLTPEQLKSIQEEQQRLGCVVNRFVLYYANVKKGCRENGECIRTT